MELIQLADQLGVHSVWSAEAYSSDAVTPLAWIGAQTKQIKLGTAIMQIPGRTPANTAMTAMTLNQLSGGRFLLGLGLSGPQVAEGWHGQSYKSPLLRTREYVEIVRKIMARQAPLTHDGTLYPIPYRGEDATGLGKPLKSGLESAELPFYLAAIGPQNVQLCAEIADGWLPIFFSPERFADTYLPALQAGWAKSGKSAETFDIAPQVMVVMEENLSVARNMVRPFIALYIGGMGAKGKNFYFDLACRYGYAESAERIQELYLNHRQAEAMMAVPDALIDEVALVGPASRIAERLQAWQAQPITTLIATILPTANARHTLQTLVNLIT